ncbi:hypothetical protein SLA2020_511230 [Shorea laevis]
MRFSSLAPDEQIVRDMIVVLLQAQEIDVGMAFHCYLLKSGLLASVSVGTALLQMYSKYDQVGLARNVFDHLNNKDVIAWSAMILAYAQGGQPFKSVDAFKEMLLMNEKPNPFIFVSLLQASSLMASQELGQSIHGYAIKVGYSLNAYLISGLIDLYCKFGKVKQGKVLFDEIPVKDVTCWGCND